MPAARLLNQINKIRGTELEIYPSSFVTRTQLLLKTAFCLRKERVNPTGFGITIAAMFVLMYRFREHSLSTVTNRFEMRCQLKQLLLSYYKIWHCYILLEFLIT